MVVTYNSSIRSDNSWPNTWNWLTFGLDSLYFNLSLPMFDYVYFIYLFRGFRPSRFNKGTGTLRSLIILQRTAKNRIWSNLQNKKNLRINCLINHILLRRIPRCSIWENIFETYKANCNIYNFPSPEKIVKGHVYFNYYNTCATGQISSRKFYFPEAIKNSIIRLVQHIQEIQPLIFINIHILSAKWFSGVSLDS